MDFRSGPRRTKIAVSESSGRQRNKRNKVCKYAETVMFIRRGSKLIRKKCYRTCSPRPDRSRVLQHVFYRSKKRRRLPSNSEPKGVKLLSDCSSFQDGNIANNYLCTRKKGLGSITRPEGCIPSCGSVPTSSQISPVLFSRPTFSVSPNAVRYCDRPKTFHKAYVSNRKSPEISTDSDFHVPGRQAGKTSRPRCSVTPLDSSLSVTREVGALDQLCKVTVGTNTEDSVSGVGVRPSEWTNLSLGGKICEAAGGNSISGKSERNLCPEVFTPVGVNDILYRPNPICQIAYAPYPVLSPVILAPTQGLSVTCDTNPGAPNSAFSMVAGSQEYFCRGASSGQSTPHSNNVDRCFHSGVGGSSGQSSGCRNLDPAREVVSHKLGGDKSHSVSPGLFSGHSRGQQDTFEMRQFHSSILHQQAGGDEVLSAMLSDMGNFSLVEVEEHGTSSSSYSRETECFSGQSFEGKDGSKNDRMEPSTGDRNSNFQEVHHSQYRSVCNEREQEAASVLLSFSRPSSLGNRCIKCGMVRDVCICIPSTNIGSSCSEEGSQRAVHNSISGTVGSKTVLVSATSRSACRLSKKVTSSRKNAHSNKRPSHSSKSRSTQSSSLENIKLLSSKTKFSRKAKDYISKSRRSSTQQLYSSRLSIYRRWCDQQNMLPDSASVEQLADFFVHLHEQRSLKATTISGYRSAIATIHSGWNGSSVSLNKDLSSLFRGIFNSKPDIGPLLSNWDLPSVLWALCDPPFEPIGTCDMKFLTWKTVFLLASATAAHVSELHALSVNPTNMRFERQGVRLLPDLKCLAKTQRLGKAWKPMFIPRFDSFATESKDIMLCPCRALTEYVSRTKAARSRTENLFLTYQQGLCKAAAKTTVSRWIVSLIRYVYDKSPDLRLAGVRAHDTRRLAASWALFNGASVQEILQAAHWASENTFTAFYLKDVCSESNFARASLLKTVDWARKRRRKEHCQEKRQ